MSILRVKIKVIVFLYENNKEFVNKISKRVGISIYENVIE